MGFADNQAYQNLEANGMMSLYELGTAQSPFWRCERLGVAAFLHPTSSHFDVGEIPGFQDSGLQVEGLAGNCLTSYIIMACITFTAPSIVRIRR
jgi:hypothetical protein